MIRRLAMQLSQLRQPLLKRIRREYLSDTGHPIFDRQRDDPVAVTKLNRSQFGMRIQQALQFFPETLFHIIAHISSLVPVLLPRP